METAACSREWNLNSGIGAAMQTRDVDLSTLSAPPTRGSADPAKLTRHGPFDWHKYTPIIVEEDGARLILQDGMTRVENARRAGITKLSAYVFPKGVMTMDELDALYTKLLSLGFVVLKQAAHSGNRDWMEAELEMLHNVPSLLGENNVERHRYYWLSERQHYIDWVSAPGREEAKSRMLTFYDPIWRQMEPLVSDIMELQSSKEAQV